MISIPRSFPHLILIGFFSLLLNARAALPAGYPESPREKTILVDGWQFFLDDVENGFYEACPTSEEWQSVTVPHMPKLASIDLDGCEDDHFQKTFHRWIAWYKRDLQIEAKDNEKVYLEFEGAHQVTKCWVNGEFVGEHSIGGYTPFHFDITEYVKLGRKNTVVLSVDNRRNANVPPDGDRYDYIKWSGLYRDVYLVVKDELHIGFSWEDKESGVFITTPTVTAENATVSIRTNVKNESSQPRASSVISRVIDDRGVVVLRLEQAGMVPAGGDYTFYQTGGIEENVRLWSIEDPYLYRVNTTIFEGDRIVDCVENPLGIRKFEFVDGKGFLLNGKEVELIGANRHQGMLFIGDAAPDSMHWKDAWQFKQAGFNSVRLAHYPHDDSFIRACDELGILVYEEPPTWIGIGGDVWFDNLEEATRRMIRNHRNHPSLLMWGAAINHRGPVERLHYACKEEDPTRPTASNGAPWTAPRNSGVCDIYTPMDYQNMPITPNEFTYLCEHGGSENASRAQFEVSKSKEMANMIGVALWTAHDYQSFKGRKLLSPRRPWSVYRVPNPSYYWYKSELTDSPMVYICDERASTEDEIVVFSNCQRVDLFVDGQLIESRTPDRSANLLYLDHPTFTFPFEWAAGTLTAKGYINGQVVADYELKKAGEAERLRLEVELDDLPFYANGSDIKWVRAFVEDENGAIVKKEGIHVTFEATGAGEILGNGVLGANPNEAYWGVASGMVRSSNQPGTIYVTARAEGLQSDTIEVQTTAFEYDRILAEAKPIFDLKRERIDLSSGTESALAGKDGLFEIGTTTQQSSIEFLQFGWSPWAGDTEAGAVFQSNIFKGCELKLRSDGELDWFTSWGMVSELPYVAIDGVNCAHGKQMQLVISGLDKGIYEMKTWHHHLKEVNRAPGSLNIQVSDARAKNRVVEDALRMTTGSNIFSLTPASSTYTIHSDGENPVVITFESKIETMVATLNGISISETISKK